MEGWEYIEHELKKGRTFSQYQGNEYNTHYRWDDTYDEIKLGFIVSLIHRKIINWNDIKISNEIIENEKK